MTALFAVLPGRARMDPIFDPRPVVLTGRHVRVEPLSQGHAADLLRAGSDPDIWRYMPRGPLRDEADIQQFIAEAEALTASGAQIAFAIVHGASGAAIGSTRYLDLRPPDRALEIGWTWLGTAHQRTPVNTECKLLLLEHAFETLGAVRVQFKTDDRNRRSQAAIERIGGRREGVLRKSLILRDGFIRDSVYYSIIDDEWSAVKIRLLAMLDRHAEQTPP